MPTTQSEGRCFDARPDRIDYRDRTYLPRLVSLPERFPSVDFITSFFPDYSGNDLVLDQGQEGACTGFGLAAVVNYLLWKSQLEGKKLIALPGVEGTLIRPEAIWDEAYAKEMEIDPVSPHMLYQMARLYDEWPGEDYEGSSCRGAMKGWYRHGVCLLKNWMKKPSTGKARVPKVGWELDAAKRPMGAYYRINKDSLNDMQSAIAEVGAIYCSAEVHPGWWLEEPDAKGLEHDREIKGLPIISMANMDPTGGHAFAFVGYTADGFIVQNSWGPDWGFNGFAVLRYRDWLLHGSDAWVAVLGAAMRIPKDFAASRTRSSTGLADVAAGKMNWSWSTETTGAAPSHTGGKADPWSEEEAYLHSIVLGNEGRPLNRLVDMPDAEAALREIVFEIPSTRVPEVAKTLPKGQPPKVVVYAHGGLNSEGDSIHRIRRLAPYFEANGIYPIFLTWRTGFWESISNILDDAVSEFVFGGPAGAGGVFDDIRQRLSDAKDRTLEVACSNILVKPVWSQMKQNADVGSHAGGGLAQFANALVKLRAELKPLEVHCVGHSAGSIILGQLLTLLGKKDFKVDSVELYAAACTVEFANRHYAGAVENGTLAKKSLYCHTMSDRREQEDSIGPYGKSLLYLVSRALEDVHKMPLLGMEGAWRDLSSRSDLWNSASAIQKQLGQWRDFVSKEISLTIHDEPFVTDGVTARPIAHGTFDNDVAVIANTIVRLRGSKPLAVEIANLSGF
ncbi:MAG: C1 family peptidase [Planctomycetaceae bacterium]|nr:C1 family peptidase [Planctomycetaceae bacterium]